LTSISEISPVLAAVESRRVRLERLLQIASGDFELRLEFGERDRIGEGQLILGMPSEKIAEARYHYLVGSLLHLFGHYQGDILLWSDAARRYESQGRPFFSALWHAIEDARLENQLISRWPGSRRAFDSRLPPNLNTNIFKLMPRTRQLELGFYLYGRGFYKATFSPSVQRILETVRNMIVAGAKGNSPRASLEAAQGIYPQVAHILRASEIGDQLGNEPADADEKLEVTDTGDEGHSPASGETPEFDEDDGIYSVDVLGIRTEFPEWYRPGSAPWFERGLGEKSIHPSAVRTDRQTIVQPPAGDPVEYRRLWSDVQQEVGYLTRRLTNRLREEVYLRYGGYYRSGKINMAKLWKQRLGNYRLFQRATSGSEHWLAVSMLVDESASMKGQEKYLLATKTALLLGETLEQLGIPFEIIGYTTSEYEARAAMNLSLFPAYEYRTTRCSPLEHRVYKNFEEPYRYVRRRLTGLEPRHNNWDEEHLHFAFRRLQSRSEDRKLLIVISDGQPNGDAEHLIDTVRLIERLGTRVIAIGVGADYVCEIYSEAIVIKDFRQLAKDLFQLLTREISGGVQQTEVQSSHYAFAGTTT
jgi:hypothetical protein